MHCLHYQTTMLQSTIDYTVHYTIDSLILCIARYDDESRVKIKATLLYSVALKA